MGIIKKLMPFLEIDLGSKKLFYSSESVKIRDGDVVKQYEGRLQREQGVSRSFSIDGFKASSTFSSGVSIINDENNRLQDVFTDHPDSLTSVKLYYLYGNNGSKVDDTTSKFEEIIGIASNPKWNKVSFSTEIKDSQKLYFKNVPQIILDERTFQISTILSDATLYTNPNVVVGNSSIQSNSGPSGAGSRTITLVDNIVSSIFAGRPPNYWKGSRIDVINDQRASDDTNNASGQFAIVMRSYDSTVFLNNKVDRYLVRDDETALSVLNNTLMTTQATYLPENVTLQVIRNPLPQNSDSVGKPIPIIYGSPEKVPMIWAIGQKSTRTNSFGCGDDIYLFASHRCKIGPLPDETTYLGLTATSANNGVYSYSSNSSTSIPKDHKEIVDGLRAEVYWSLEDKRVVDARISPGNVNWIPNPFPKRLRNSGGASSNVYRDHPIRLISPLHRIKIMKTLKGEIVHAVQLRGGEFDWFDVSYPFEQRGQYPIRYGMGNSKLYVSVDGFEDDLDGFFTGHQKTFSKLLTDPSGNLLGDPDYLENQKNTVLIKNPADVLLHFIMNFSSVDYNKDLINLESFRKARAMLDGWRIDTAITEIINGQDFVDRLCAQCCSILFMDRGKFKLKTIIPSKLVSKIYLRENEHILEQSFEMTKTEDIYNDFIFKYNYDYVHEQFASVIKRNKSNDTLCRQSFAINGFERAKEVIEFRDVKDEYTANQLADTYVDFYSKRRTFLNAQLDYNQEVIDANIEIGDCVEVTSNLAPRRWDRKRCLVMETQKATDSMGVSLMEI